MMQNDISKIPWISLEPLFKYPSNVPGDTQVLTPFSNPVLCTHCYEDLYTTDCFNDSEGDYYHHHCIAEMLLANELTISQVFHLNTKELLSARVALHYSLIHLGIPISDTTMLELHNISGSYEAAYDSFIDFCDDKGIDT